MKYPESYHRAVGHLVAFGGHRKSTHGRKLIADALRDLRRTFGRERAAAERRHMLFISGQFPVKEWPAAFSAACRTRSRARD